MSAISALCNFQATDQLELADFVQETRQQLKLSQARLAATLRILFQSVNRGQHGQTKPLPIVLKQIAHLLRQMGNAGKGWLTQYFSE